MPKTSYAANVIFSRNRNLGMNICNVCFKRFSDKAPHIIASLDRTCKQIQIADSRRADKTEQACIVAPRINVKSIDFPLCRSCETIKFSLKWISCSSYRSPSVQLLFRPCSIADSSRVVQKEVGTQRNCFTLERVAGIH